MNILTIPVYNYDMRLGFFTYVGTASEDPEHKGRYLIPAFSTDIQIPPYDDTKEIPVIDSISNPTKWTILENHLNKLALVKATQEQIQINYLGKLKPEHTFKTIPEKEVCLHKYFIWSEKDDNWILDKSKENELFEEIQTTYDSIRDVESTLKYEYTDKNKIVWLIRNNDIARDDHQDWYLAALHHKENPDFKKKIICNRQKQVGDWKKDHHLYLNADEIIELFHNIHINREEKVFKYDELKEKAYKLNLQKKFDLLKKILKDLENIIIRSDIEGYN